VLLHEVSHFVSARVLGVRAGHLSLIPKPLADGKVQLGYVETAQTDFLRDALIGMAPLVWGSVFIAYAGLIRLDLTSLWLGLKTEGGTALPEAFFLVYQRPDFWLWFYLIFVVSSSMMPSRSDRRAWLPLSLFVGLLIGLSLLAGAGPWLMQNLALPLNHILRVVAMVFGVSLGIHLLLLLPFLTLRKLLEKLTGFKVV
jgi:hypothetical protein